jgi:hypothetical protein
MVAQGKGGTTAALGWTVFQETEALEGRTQAVIAAFPVARLGRPSKALVFGGLMSRGAAFRRRPSGDGGHVLCPGLE